MRHLQQASFPYQLWSLYHNVVNEAASFQGSYPTPSHQYSAYNVTAFLAYKKLASPEFSRSMRSRGLCLGSIAHVIHSLQVLCTNLGLLPGVNLIEDPLAIVKQRRMAVFGDKPHRDSPHIMLTLDAQMVSPSLIEPFLANGMTVARINCAYDDESVWAMMIESVRSAEERLRKGGRYEDRRCKIYMDLAGPKLRVRLLRKGTVPSTIKVKKSDRLRLYFIEPPEPGHAAEEDEVPGISVNIPEALVNIKEGHSVFIDDGKIQGIVAELHEHFADIEITSPDTLVAVKDNKGIHLPDTRIRDRLPSLTAKDEADLRFIARHADLAGLSFVNTPDDLRRLKGLLLEAGRIDLPVIAKIETKEAVNRFSGILLEGLTFPHFGVMVARGDLAMNAGFHQLSIIQEEILAMCRAAHIPVILATQVLDTLAKKGIPSRSELADLSLGSEFDCVMLNKGPFIKEAVKFLQETMLLIAEVKQNHQSITRRNAYDLF